MEIDFDPEKSERNRSERKLPFELTADLDWPKARLYPDRRKEYGEPRTKALVPMDGRLFVVCFTRRGAVFRIISFRKANRREEKAYEQATTER